jgi:hypothetical protein
VSELEDMAPTSLYDEDIVTRLGEAGVPDMESEANLALTLFDVERTAVALRDMADTLLSALEVLEIAYRFTRARSDPIKVVLHLRRAFKGVHNRAVAAQSRLEITHEILTNLQILLEGAKLELNALEQDLKRLRPTVPNLIPRALWLIVKYRRLEKTSQKHCDQIDRTATMALYPRISAKLRLKQPWKFPGQDKPIHQQRMTQQNFTQRSELRQRSP